MADKMYITLEVDDKGTAVIKKFDRNTKNAFDKMKKNAKGGITMAGRMKKAWVGAIGSIKKHWKGLAVTGVAAIYGVTKAITGSISKIKEWVGIANVQEAAETRLAAVVRATGQAAGFTAKEMFQMAAEMQKVTTVGDEVSIAGMAILATFKQIRGEGFKRTMMAAADMAEVMQTDLKSALVMLGKALNDPIANLSAMSRAGVQFSKVQKDQIKVMWEAGNTAGAQAIILKELEAQFGGTAAAARDIFGGAVIAAGNALGDMKEELGFIITKNQFFIDLVKMAEEQFISWGEEINKNREYLGSLAKEGVLKVVDAIIAGIEIMRFFQNGWMGLQLVANVAINAIVIGLDTLFKALRFISAPLDLIFAGLVKIGVIASNPFDKIQAGLADFAVSSLTATDSVLSDIKKTNSAYDSVIAKIEEWKNKIAEVPVVAAKEAAKIEALKPKFKIDPVAIDQLDDVKKKAQDTADAIEGMKPTFSVSAQPDGALMYSGVRKGTSQLPTDPDAIRKALIEVRKLKTQGIGMGPTTRYYGESLLALTRNLVKRLAWATGSEAKAATVSYQTGTGPEGLPSTGLFHGHKGEIVKSPEESDTERRGRGKRGRALIIEKLIFAPTFMTGDGRAGRNAAREMKRELEALGVRLD